MKNVCVMLLTYNRFEYAKITLQSTLENIRYGGPLSVHIADDGSPGTYVADLIEVAKKYDVSSVSSTNSNHRGYGANYNAATQVVHGIADIVLPLEDDWQLTRMLEMERFIPALDTFGCIRLGYLGFTQPLHGVLKHVADATWLQLWERSYEPHVWTGHPRLETVDWQRAVGPWPELLEPGPTEFHVAKKEAARVGVAWPMSYVTPEGNLFAHIGTDKSPNSMDAVDAIVV
jgi:glycosyltransferase involved in cell wall biosynthesis